MRTPHPGRPIPKYSLFASLLLALSFSACRSTQSDMADLGRSLTFGLFEKNYSAGGVTSLEKQRDFERRATSQNSYQQSMNQPIRD